VVDLLKGFNPPLQQDEFKQYKAAGQWECRETCLCFFTVKARLLKVACSRSDMAYQIIALYSTLAMFRQKRGKARPKNIAKTF